MIVGLTSICTTVAAPSGSPHENYPPYPHSDQELPNSYTITAEHLRRIIQEEAYKGEFDTAIKISGNRLTVQEATDLAESYFNQLADIYPQQQEHLAVQRAAVLGRLAEIDMHQGNTNRTNAARSVLQPERRTPSFGTFLKRHGGKAGLALYHGLDGALQHQETVKKGEGLSSKTARDIHDGFKDSIGFSLDNQNSISSIARAVRPITSIGYGLTPWANEIATSRLNKLFPEHHHTFRKQSPLSKGAGLANLATLAANGMYTFATRKNSTLNAKDAYLLSYFNRRHGVPHEITGYKKTMSTLAKARWVIRVVGLAALPGLLAAFSKGKHADKSIATSPAMLIGNLAGIADSLMSIFERYRTQRMIKQIKKVTPLVEQELRQRPPTAEEKAADQEAGETLNFQGMFGGGF